MVKRCRIFWAGGGVAALVFLVAGCGGSKIPTYRAGGKVTFPDGKPLARGSVMFRTADGGRATARGQIQPDGSFKLSTFAPDDGAVAGKHQVLVVVPLLGTDPEGPAPPTPSPIDPRFAGYETSGLEFIVNDSGQNQFEIVVTPPEKKSMKR
jgi:hypothetical protein